MEEIAKSAKPDWQPDGKIPNDRRAMYTPLYGLTDFYHLFTNRQLVALSTFSDLVLQAREKAFEDAIASGLKKDGERLRDGGSNAETYADAIATYLGLGVSRLSDICNSLCMWENTKTQVDTFSHVKLFQCFGTLRNQMYLVVVLLVTIKLRSIQCFVLSMRCQQEVLEKFSN